MGQWRSFVSWPQANGPPAKTATMRAPQPRGWACYEQPLFQSQSEHEDTVIRTYGPVIVASVMDSDVCFVTGGHAGSITWKWTFGQVAPLEDPPRRISAEEWAELEDGLPERAREVAAAIIAWAREVGFDTPDGGDIAALLERGYVFEEEGFFALLGAIGLPLERHQEVLPRASTPPTVSSGALAPPPRRVPGLQGHEPTVPMAIAIDHRSAGWRRLVLRKELERWGEPSAFVVVDRGTYLTTDPPISVGGWSAGDPSGLDRLARSDGATGVWVPVPPEHRTVEAVAAWARDNVGRQGAPPSPNRPPLGSEAQPWDGMKPRQKYTMTPPPRLVMRVATYVDLYERLDELGAWLDGARDEMVRPVMSAHTDVLTWIDPDDYIGGPPHGLLVTTSAWTIKGRLSLGAGDDRGWGRKMGQLTRGDLRELKLEVTALSGAGRPSDLRGSILIQVVLRDQFVVDDPGPLPADHPASIYVDASQTLLATAGDDRVVDRVVDRARRAAVEFDAVKGYVFAGARGNELRQADEMLWVL